MFTKNECGPGKIKRKGYRRKGYLRNEFTRGDGVHVPSTYVSASRVPSTCVKDMGKKGRGEKTLPTPGDEIHLSRYGYGIHKSQSERRKALRKASGDFNALSVLRRINLLRNFQPVPEIKKIFSKDVEYMKRYYARIKKQSQGGGGEVLNVNSHMNVQCQNAKCKTEVKDSRTIGGQQVIFRTLGPDDLRQLNLAVRGQVVGLTVDSKLCGYCAYELKGDAVQITSFWADKGCRTLLRKYVEGYFAKLGFKEVDFPSSMQMDLGK